MVVAAFAVTLTMCVTVTEMHSMRNEFEEGMSMFVPTCGPALLWHSHST